VTSQKQNLTSSDGIYFTRDVCRELRITRRTLHTWIATGLFPLAAADVNGRWIWPADVITVWKRCALAGKFSSQRSPHFTALQVA